MGQNSRKKSRQWWKLGEEDVEAWNIWHDSRKVLGLLNFCRLSVCVCVWKEGIGWGFVSLKQWCTKTHKPGLPHSLIHAWVDTEREIEGLRKRGMEIKREGRTDGGERDEEGRSRRRDLFLIDLPRYPRPASHVIIRSVFDLEVMWRLIHVSAKRWNMFYFPDM